MLAAAALPGPPWRGSAQSGRSSGVEHNLAKVGVEGSNPFARSSSLGNGNAPMLWIALLFAAAQTPPAPAAPAPAPAAPTVEQGVVTTPSGLRIQTLEAGTGEAPQPGGAVLVTYEGRLADGTVFDSAAEPVGLPVSRLVPGFTEALLMMRTGGRYRIWIPANLAYGERGAGGIVPPNAELDFTVTLHRVGQLGEAPAPEASD